MLLELFFNVDCELFQGILGIIFESKEGRGEGKLGKRGIFRKGLYF